MKIQQNRTTQVQVTFHTYELAALVAAARWVAEGAEGELAPDAIGQLTQVLTSYDRAWQEANQPQT